jgi:hypothetical protein
MMQSKTFSVQCYTSVTLVAANRHSALHKCHLDDAVKDVGTFGFERPLRCTVLHKCHLDDAVKDVGTFGFERPLRCTVLHKCHLDDAVKDVGPFGFERSPV